jgi:hypothetical protein
LISLHHQPNQQAVSLKRKIAVYNGKNDFPQRRTSSRSRGEETRFLLCSEVFSFECMNTMNTMNTIVVIHCEIEKEFYLQEETGR